MLAGADNWFIPAMAGFPRVAHVMVLGEFDFAGPAVVKRPMRLEDVLVGWVVGWLGVGLH